MIIAIVTFEIDKELNDTILKEKFLEKFFASKSGELKALSLKSLPIFSILL